MKIKFASLLIAIFIAVFSLFAVQASVLDCGLNIGVTFGRVDNQGYAPRLKEGAQAQFDCVTAYDPNFINVRLPSEHDAINYWYTLMGQAWGVTFQPLPAPTG